MLFKHLDAIPYIVVKGTISLIKKEQGHSRVCLEGDDFTFLVSAKTAQLLLLKDRVVVLAALEEDDITKTAGAEVLYLAKLVREAWSSLVGKGTLWERRAEPFM